MSVYESQFRNFCFESKFLNQNTSLAEYLFVLSVCVEMFFFSSAGGASGVEHQDSESMLSPYLSECSINSL